MTKAGKSILRGAREALEYVKGENMSLIPHSSDLNYLAMENYYLQERIKLLENTLREIDEMLTCPAAEYVPVIPEVWKIIGKVIKNDQTME